MFGTIGKIYVDKKYFWVRSGSKTYFAHATGLVDATIVNLRSDDDCEFDLIPAERGPQAVNIRVTPRRVCLPETGTIDDLSASWGFILRQDKSRAFFHFGECDWQVSDADLDAKVGFNLIQNSRGFVCVAIRRLP